MTTPPERPGTDRFMPRLVAKSGPTSGCEYTIKVSTIVIGRSEQCEIVIADPLVSRRHSQITFDGSYCTIEDLGSTNGTYVNEQLLTAPYVLHNGDRIRIADALLVFTDPQATLTGLKLPALLLEAPNRVYVNRRLVELSAKEFALVAYLFDHTGRVCSKGELARAVWPEWKGEVFDYHVESLVRRARQKIETAPDEPRFIVTVRGKGYQLIKP